MITVQVLHFQINNKNNVSQMMLLFCDEGFSTDQDYIVYTHKGCIHNAKMATHEKKIITETQSQDEKNTLSFEITN